MTNLAALFDNFINQHFAATTLEKSLTKSNTNFLGVKKNNFGNIEKRLKYDQNHYGKGWNHYISEKS